MFRSPLPIQLQLDDRYCGIGGKTAKSIAEEVVAQVKAVIVAAAVPEVAHTVRALAARLAAGNLVTAPAP